VFGDFASEGEIRGKILIGIGRGLTTPLLPHHLAYGSRTKAVRLVKLTERIDVATLKRQSNDRATQSRVQDYDSSARGHEPIWRYSTPIHNSRLDGVALGNHDDPTVSNDNSEAYAVSRSLTP